MKKIVLGSIIAFALTQGFALAQTYAKVNGEAVTERDIGALMRAMPGVSFEQLPQEAKQQVISQAIDRKLLIEQAKKDKVEKTKEYKEAIESVGDDIALEIWMRQEMNKVKVSDGEMKKFYNDNKDKFVQQEAIKARHILVANENEAKKIIADLKKAGNKVQDKFIELAKAQSKDGSAANGGDLGWFGKQQMVPEFANAAFALKKGTYSKSPVKTNFGYHVIYVEDKRAKRTLGYDEVKNQIEQNIRIKKFQDSIKSESEALRKKAKIEISK